MTQVRRDRRSALGTVRVGFYAVLVAPAGLGLGHLLAYGLAGADGEAHLAATGHGYLPLALRLAIVVGLLGAVWAVVSGARRARRAAEGPTLLPTAVRLAAIQSAGFAVLEVLERLVAGAALADLGPLLAVGFLVQVLVAGLLASFLVGLDRVGEVLVSSRRPAAPRPEHRAAPRSTWPVGVVEARAWSERAPPLVFFS